MIYQLQRAGLYLRVYQTRLTRVYICVWNNSIASYPKCLNLYGHPCTHIRLSMISDYVARALS